MRKQVKNELSELINSVIADFCLCADPTSAEVADYVLEHHRDLVSQQGEWLAVSAIRRMVQDRMKRSTRSEVEQLNLLGVHGLPGRLSYEEAGEVHYCNLRNATEAKLIAHDQLLSRQVEADTMRRDAVRALHAKLEPIFSQHPGISVAQACSFLDSDALGGAA